MPKVNPNDPVQSPNHFLNALVDHLRLKNDKALARVLDVGAPVLSKIRHNRLRVTASILIKAHDATGLSINDLRALLYANKS